MVAPIYPDFQATANQGFQIGQSRLATQLSGQAINGQGQDRAGALQQLAMVDPQGQQKLVGQFKDQETDHMAKFGSAANAMVNAIKSGNPQQIEGTYQATRPYLAELSAKAGGPPPPDHWDPAMEPAVYQAQASTQYASQQKMPAALQTFNAMTQNMSGDEQAQARRIKAGLDPRASNPNYSEMKVPDGKGGTIQAFFNKRTGQLESPDYSVLQGGQSAPTTTAAPTQPYGMQTQITPASPVNSGAAGQANALLAKGMNPQQVMQQVVQANPGQQFQLAVDPATGQFKDVSDGSAKFPQSAAAPATSAIPAAASPVGGMGYTAPKADKQTSLQERIATAKSMGATNDDIRSMVLGGRGQSPEDSGLSDDAVQNLAWDYALNGKLPPVGRGGAGQAQRTAVINATADLAKEYGLSPSQLATTSGRNKAFQMSLSNTQKQTDTIDRASETFHRNADIMQQLADQVNAQGPQAWNRFIIGVKNNITTDPTVAAYLAAQQTASQEYAKVASGATGAAGSTDSAREHANSVINANQTPDQLRAVLHTLQQDTENQRQVAHEKLGQLLTNMQQFGTYSPNSPVGQAINSAQQTASPSGSTQQPAQGQQPSTDFSHLWGG